MSQQSSATRRNIAESFSNEIIKALEKGTAPWTKPWKAGEIALPRNPVTGTLYRGANSLKLLGKGYSDPRWMTFHQANDNYMRVKKGSKSERVVFWQWTTQETILDENGEPVLIDGKEQKETVPLTRPRLHFYNVFNATQLTKDGKDIEPLKSEPLNWNPDDRAEIILRNSGIDIRHDQRDRAFYDPMADQIHLPPRENFPDSGAYYSTALHEFAHATMSPERLDREEGSKSPFGSPEYAKEELRAEIASWMIAAELGLPFDPGEHLSYINSWIKILEKDPYEIMRASRDAEKIKEYVMGLDKEQEQTQEKVILSEKTAQQERGENTPSKLFINVPYTEKSAAKELGAKWDRREKSWFIPEGVEQEPFAKWIPQPSSENELSGNIAQEKILLNVPFQEKDVAKELGAKWDRGEKSWYVPEGSDLNKFTKWVPGQEPDRQSENVLNPHEEFANFARKLGLIIEGTPVLDGKIYRTAVEGGKVGAKDGAYCGYADGHPNGWCQNYRSGVQEKWIASGHYVSSKAKIALQQEAVEEREAKEKERAQQRAKAEKRAYAKWINASPLQNYEYLDTKKVMGENLRQDKQGNIMIPAYDLKSSKLKNIQYINPKGGKWYEKGCGKSGAVHLLGYGKNEKPENVLIAEGYATGASLHLATKMPVAVAFDAGNLKGAALAIREKFTDSQIIICADNDDHHPSGINIGIEKAKEAAAVVNGKVVAPEFTEKERESKLTDFNDLYISRGLDAVYDSVAGRIEEQEEEVER